MHRRTKRLLTVLTLYGSIPNRILHPEKHLFGTLTNLGRGKRRSRKRRRGDAGMFELSKSCYLVSAFLLIAVPSLCDASVATEHADIVPIYPIFPVSLPTNSVDSRLLPRISPVFPFSHPPILAPMLGFKTTQSFLYSTTIKR